MTIPENETGLPLVTAVHAATGRRPHISTVLRWCQSKNRYGVKLESWLIGGRRVTSVEAVVRYNQRSTIAADREPTISPHTSRQARSAQARAMAELDAAGV